MVLQGSPQQPSKSAWQERVAPNGDSARGLGCLRRIAEQLLNRSPQARGAEWLLQALVWHRFEETGDFRGHRSTRQENDARSLVGPQAKQLFVEQEPPFTQGRLEAAAMCYSFLSALKA